MMIRKKTHSTRCDWDGTALLLETLLESEVNDDFRLLRYSEVDQCNKHILILLGRFFEDVKIGLDLFSKNLGYSSLEEARDRLASGVDEPILKYILDKLEKCEELFQACEFDIQTHDKFIRLKQIVLHAQDNLNLPLDFKHDPLSNLMSALDGLVARVQEESFMIPKADVKFKLCAAECCLSFRRSRENSLDSGFEFAAA